MRGALTSEPRSRVTNQLSLAILIALATAVPIQRALAASSHVRGDVAGAPLVSDSSDVVAALGRFHFAARSDRLAHRCNPLVFAQSAQRLVELRQSA